MSRSFFAAVGVYDNCLNCERSTVSKQKKDRTNLPFWRDINLDIVTAKRRIEKELSLLEVRAVWNGQQLALNTCWRIIDVDNEVNALAMCPLHDSLTVVVEASTSVVFPLGIYFQRARPPGHR